MKTEKRQADLTKEEIAARGVTQAAVLNELMTTLGLKNHAALSRALEMEPAVISKLCSGKLPFTPLYLVASEELAQNHGYYAGWQIADLKRKLGLRRLGDPKPGDQG